MVILDIPRVRHISSKFPHFYNNMNLLVFYFFASHNEKFWRYLPKSGAPLHPTIPKSFICNSLCRVHRRVHVGAPGCTAGATWGTSGAVHHDLKQSQSRGLPQMVQGCTVKNPFFQFQTGIFVPVKWKKNTLFISCILIVSFQLIYSYFEDLSYPVKPRCQPLSVTWLTTQTKERNQTGQNGMIVTAHNYKLCGKGVLPRRNITDVERQVINKSAVRIITSYKSYQFGGIDQSGSYPPPHQKLTTIPAPSPLYGFINCSQFSNLFRFSVLPGSLPFLGGRGGSA